MKNDYSDIIDHPHYVSKTRPQMSELERAAQFSPFAALTGYDAAIQETGRLTDERMEIGEEEKAMLDRKQQYLLEIISDKRKSGGAYVSVTGKLKRLDDVERMLVLTDGKKIPLDDITDLESKSFRGIL